MSSIVLFTILVLLLICTFFLQERQFLSPSVLYSSVFLIAVLNGLTQYNNWAYELSWITVALIAASVGVFCLSAAIVHIIFRVKYGAISQRIQSARTCILKAPSITIPSWFYVIALMTQIGTAIVVLLFIMKAVDAEQNGYSISQAIGQYDALSKFSNFDKPVRGILGFLYVASSSSGYVWSFIVLIKILKDHHFEALAFLNFLVSLFAPLLTGGRAGTIQLVLACLIMFFLFSNLFFKKKSKSFSLIIASVSSCLLLLGLLIFKPVAQLLGRDVSQFSVYEYLSIYIGAPVKNLDIFLAQHYDSLPLSNYFGETTFTGIVQSVCRWANIPYVKHFGVTQPFQTMFDSELGNVYTSLYSLIWDFGFWGCLFFVFLMAVIMQLVFEWIYVPSSKWCRQPIDLSIILYVFLVYGVIFAFLSNRFYSTVVSTLFIREFATWLFACVLCRLFLKIRR